MRYITDAQKKRVQDRVERLRWMTLVEAVTYIKDRQRCDDHEALEDLFCAIVDGKVRALSADISYQEHTISGYDLLSKSDLQREVKVSLDGPGYIYLPSSKTAEVFEYPVMTIVAGRIDKVVYPKSYPASPPVLPKVDELLYVPVLVSRDDLEKWPFASNEEPAETTASSSEVTGSSVPDATSASRRRRGRPPESGRWAAADAPLLTRMHELIEAGKAKSATDAARLVAGEAEGSGSPESKITRLRKRYSNQHSLERK